MSHEIHNEPDRKIDPRDVREGGWYWVQQELLYVFTPLIGPDAAWLYTTMCQLIPQSIENPLMELTFRLVSRTSGQSIGTVHRNMKKLIAVGMIEETRGLKGRPSTYKLVSLRKLAGVGVEALQKRLRVPPGNAAAKESGGGDLGEERGRGAKRRSGRAAALEGSAEESVSAAKAHAGAEARSVPPGNAGDEEAMHGAHSGEVFQKRGGSVPKRGGLRSKKGGVAFQQSDPLIKTIYLESSTTPLPPVPGEGEDELLLPFEDCGHRNPALGFSLGLASRWVMQRCGISDRRMEKTIQAALSQRCQLNRETLRTAATLMQRNAEEYQGYAAQGLLRIQYGWPKFLGHGHWQFPATWAIDQEKVRERQHASAGMYRPRA